MEPLMFFCSGILEEGGYFAKVSGLVLAHFLWAVREGIGDGSLGRALGFAIWELISG
jgi:hypothetical protein